MSEKQQVVLDVGQCAADHAAIRGVCEGFGARVERAHTGLDALTRIAAGGIDLVLINRVLDRDGADGIALIRDVVAQYQGSLAVMLVSDYPQFQQQAVEFGAVLGFGKSRLHSSETRELLRACLTKRAQP